MINDHDTREDPMASYLEAMARDACYRVDHVLKESAAETTEVVYFAGACDGAELGPYVRKRLDRAAGLGAIYRELYEVQRRGRRFRYLPRIYDCHEAGEQLVVVMDYVEGGTLYDLVEATAPQDRLALAARVMPALCRAVSELHEGLGRPVVHRDLTPSNVVCSQNDPSDLVVIDLGIARLWQPAAQKDTAYFGTRAYAPPEQYGFGQTTPRTDVYALGATCFFCLAGREAVNADRARGFGDPAVPEPVAAVIAHACDLAPEARYGSATELGTALERAFEVAEREQQGTPGNGSIADNPSKPPGLLRRAMARVPLWAGDLWNLVVVGTLAVLVTGCVAGMMTDLGNLQGRPAWYIVYEYLGFLLTFFGLAAYALLDKRRLRREYGWMRRHSVGRERAVCLLAAAGLFALWIVVSLVVSALGVKLVA